MSPHATIRDGGTIHHHLCAYGWPPHPPDHCDVLNNPVRIAAALPEVVELHSRYSAVGGQGETGSCPAIALNGAPELFEIAVGRHAVPAAGYVRPERRFIVCNSWGIYPGMRGTSGIPFDYLAGRTLGDDSRTIRCGENL